jgi:hypothetical protein
MTYRTDSDQRMKFTGSIFLSTSRNRLLALICVLLLSCLRLSAQSTFGSILGTVKDPGGAIVPGASVTVTNIGTTNARSTKSDSAGEFVFSNLDAGNYTLSIEAPGFATLDIPGLNLLARESKRVKASLTVGGVNETVTVSGTEAGVITTDESSISQTKTGRELVDLPVAITSRSTGSTSAYSTLTTEPGIQTDDSNQLVIAGTTPAMQSYTIDGISSVAVEFSGPLTELFPSFNSISEIHVGESNNGAEFSGVTDVTTTSKGGTNKLNGGIFENDENTALNAGDPFAGNKAKIIMHDFGGYLGGPIVLPKIYNGHDKTFFFASYEGLRLPRETFQQFTVPTLAMRSGNLCSYLTALYGAGSEPALHKADGSAVACDSVPTSAVAANAMKYLMATPNSSDPNSISNNYQVNYATPLTSNQADLRIDRNLTPKQLIYGRYTYKKFSQTQAQQNPIASPTTSSEVDSGLTIAYNYAISPSLLNEVRGGFNGTNQKTGYNADPSAIVSEVGIEGLNFIPTFATLPNFSINNFSGTGNGNAVQSKSRIIQLFDDLTWTKHGHTIKFGVDARRFTDHDGNVFGSDRLGDYSFDGSSAVSQTIGDPFAAFLMGYPDSVGLAQVSDPDMNGRGYAYAGYAQDSWQVTHSLTLNFGLRYELHPPLTALNNNTAAFLPNAVTSVDGTTVHGTVVVPNNKGLALVESGFAASISPTPIITAAQAGIPSSLRYTNKTDFGPRVGFAWRPFHDDKTVIRGGWGRFIEPPLGFSMYTGWAVSTSYFATFVQSYTDDQPALAFPSPFPAAAETGGVTGTANFYDTFPIRYTDPVMQQWNFTFERDLGFNTGIRISYIGSHGSKLDAQTDLNQVRANTVGYATASASRDYPLWNVVDSVNNSAKSNYNSISTEFNRRLSKGLQFQVSYYFTRDLSNSAGATPGSLVGVGGSMLSNRFDPLQDYGNVTFDRRHRFMTTFLYELPFGTNKMFLGNANPVIKNVVGNWQLSGVLISQSGSFLTPSEPGTDPSGTGTGIIYGPSRTDLDHTVSRFGHGFTNGQHQFLNPAAFTTPDSNIGRFANAPVGSVTGPGTQSLSMSIIKSIDFEKRFKAQFGLQAANALNHRNYFNPDTNTADAAFGALTSLQTAEGAGPRLVQLTGRITF